MIVSDSFGRPFRQGTTDVALGVAGLTPMLDLRGVRDRVGYELHATQIAVADELAGAAELVMGKVGGIPAAVIRGVDLRGPGTGADILIPEERDLFRSYERFERQSRQPLPDHGRELEAVAAAGGADDDAAPPLEQELVVLPRRVEARLRVRRPGRPPGSVARPRPPSARQARDRGRSASSGSVGRPDWCRPAFSPPVGVAASA